MSESKVEKHRIYNDLISTLYVDIKDYINSEDGKDLTYIEIAAMLDFLSKHFKDNSCLTDVVNMTDVMIKAIIRNGRKHNEPK